MIVIIQKLSIFEFMLTEPMFSSMHLTNSLLQFCHVVFLLISVIKLQICENRNLAIYAFDEMKMSVVHKIPCNVIRVETGHLNNMAIVLSKHNPFTHLINFQ